MAAATAVELLHTPPACFLFLLLHADQGVLMQDAE
jgi:hypothetical protein